jgi:hypothetical protein
MRRPAVGGAAAHASIWQYLTDNLDFFEALFRSAHPFRRFCGDARKTASRIRVSTAFSASHGS